MGIAWRSWQYSLIQLLLEALNAFLETLNARYVVFAAPAVRVHL